EGARGEGDGVRVGLRHQLLDRPLRRVLVERDGTLVWPLRTDSHRRSRRRRDGVALVVVLVRGGGVVGALGPVAVRVCGRLPGPDHAIAGGLAVLAVGVLAIFAVRGAAVRVRGVLRPHLAVDDDGGGDAGGPVRAPVLLGGDHRAATGQLDGGCRGIAARGDRHRAGRDAV